MSGGELLRCVAECGAAEVGEGGYRSRERKLGEGLERESIRDLQRPIAQKGAALHLTQRDDGRLPRLEG